MGARLLTVLPQLLQAVHPVVGLKHLRTQLAWGLACDALEMRWLVQQLWVRLAAGWLAVLCSMRWRNSRGTFATHDTA